MSGHQTSGRHVVPPRARHMVLLAALALTVSAGSALGGRPTDSSTDRSTNPVSCTHGASSLGPISLVDGAGDPAPPVPATEACLP